MRLLSAALGLVLATSAVSRSAELTEPRRPPRPRSLLAAATLSALAGGFALYADGRAKRAYWEYGAASSDFDSKWNAVRHWEIARDAAGFMAGAAAVGAAVVWFSGRRPNWTKRVEIVPAFFATGLVLRIHT